MSLTWINHESGIRGRSIDWGRAIFVWRARWLRAEEHLSENAAFLWIDLNQCLVYSGGGLR